MRRCYVIVVAPRGKCPRLRPPGRLRWTRARIYGQWSSDISRQVFTRSNQCPEPGSNAVLTAGAATCHSGAGAEPLRVPLIVTNGRGYFVEASQSNLTRLPGRLLLLFCGPAGDLFAIYPENKRGSYNQSDKPEQRHLLSPGFYSCLFRGNMDGRIFYDIDRHLVL